MGLLNLFNKRKQSKGLSNDINNDNTNKSNYNNNKFKFVIQDIFNIKVKGCVVVGMVENSVMNKGDAVYILKANGETLKTYITGIELYKAGLINQAVPGQNVGVFLQELETEQLDKGDILVNASCEVFKNEPVIDEKNEEHKNENLRNGIVTERRRNELGTVVFQTNIKTEMLIKLSIQECCFILKSLEHFNSKSPLSNYNANRAVVYNVIIDKIKTSSNIYVLFDKATGQPFIGNELTEIYSTKYWADKAVEHYKESYRQLYVENFTLDGTDKINSNLFAYLFFLGMENMLLDNGAYSFQFKRSEILPPPDWRNLDPESVPVTNPSLRLAVNQYLDEARWGVNYEEREQNVAAKEKDMIDELKKGKYLAPIKTAGEEQTEKNEVTFKEGGTLSFALITNEQDKSFVPLFTDYLEFEKAYNKDQWKASILNIKDALAISKDKEGIVINPFGENLIISNVLASEIFKDML